MRTVHPEGQIGAICSGQSTYLNLTPQVCSRYLGTLTPPGHDPLALRDEVAEALAGADLVAGAIEFTSSVVATRLWAPNL